MDATYQTSLRELNEINFALFDAKMERRIAGVGGKIDVLETRVGDLKTDLERKMDLLFSEQRQIITRAAASESRMIRWMITLWSGSILATLGVTVSVFSSR